MLKKIANKLSQYPGVYTFLRKIIENNFNSQRKVIKEELKEPGKILDIACGIGEFSVYFDKDKKIGLDNEEKYINYAKKKFNRTFIIGDALDLNFKKNSFDSILMSGFLHHLSDEDITKAIKEVHKVLKKGGKFLLI